MQRVIDALVLVAIREFISRHGAMTMEDYDLVIAEVEAGVPSVLAFLDPEPMLFEEDIATRELACLE